MSTHTGIKILTNFLHRLLLVTLGAGFGSAGSAQTPCTGTEPVECLAMGEFSEAGSVIQGDFTSTFASDGALEVLAEQDAAIGPPPKRADLLQHTWEFDITVGNSYSFHVEAFRSDPGDGDDFRFSFSTDAGQSWTPMLVVDSDTAASYRYDFLTDIGGSLWVQVVDTDRTPKNKNHATLSVDRMYVEVSDAPPPEPEPDPTTSGKRIIGYFTSWSIYARDYFVMDIPAQFVTHINYAFANLDSSGNLVIGDEFADINKAFGNEPPNASFKGNFQQLNILKSANPHVKTLISVGGWTWSDHFSDVFADPAKRQTFCDSAIDFATTYGFDGVDIDWEYPGDPGEGDNGFRPNGEDAANFVAVLALCRPAFEAAGKLLTIATPCNPNLYEHPTKGGELDLLGLLPYVDWVNLLSYDLHGPWSPVTGHHSHLYMNPGDPDGADPVLSRFNQDACVQGHIAEGVPPEKIVLGIPTYGRAFARVTDAAGGNPAIRGLFQNYDGVPKGTWDGGRWGITGVFDYQDILENVLTDSSALRAFDAAAQTPTITWDLGKNKGLGFMTYDDDESIGDKTGYVLDLGLDGVMFWEFSGDIENDPRSLIRAAYCGLNPGCAECQALCQ